MVALRRARVRSATRPWADSLRSRVGVDSPTKSSWAGGKMFHFKSPTDAESRDRGAHAPGPTPEAIRTRRSRPPRQVSVNELWPGYVGDVLGGVQGKVVAIADCLGDWREELIVSLPGELRIYSTTTPATTRRTCLMEDRQYRTSVARQTMGYFYPPIPREP